MTKLAETMDGHYTVNPSIPEFLNLLIFQPECIAGQLLWVNIGMGCFLISALFTTPLVMGPPG